MTPPNQSETPRTFCSKCGEETSGFNHICKQPSELDLILNLPHGSSSNIAREAAYEVAKKYKDKVEVLERELVEASAKFNELVKAGTLGWYDSMFDQNKKLEQQLTIAKELIEKLVQALSQNDQVSHSSHTASLKQEALQLAREQGYGKDK